MIDREKVIKGLEICTTRPCYCTDCPYTANCVLDSQELMEDALVLLKEKNECENCAMAIEDRQLVVRCKDCCFFRRSKTIAQHSCVLHENRCQENDFCSWAVKKK